MLATTAACTVFQGQNVGAPTLLEISDLLSSTLSWHCSPDWWQSDLYPSMGARLPAICPRPGSRFLKKRYNPIRSTRTNGCGAIPTYEAIYEDGELEWIGDEPAPGRHRVEVTVLDQKPDSRDPEEVQRILDESDGAWDTDKSVEEIDEESQSGGSIR